MNPNVPSGPNADKPDLVVLLHGICSSRSLLRPLAARLRAQGFETRLWTYFTLRGSNRGHGAALARELRRLAALERYGRVHVVAHSMGSIVTRCALGEGVPPEVGRVVLIGPPNSGSHMATLLTPVYGWFVPTLRELRDTPDSFVNALGPVPAHVEVGVLAASNDRMVHLERTHVAGQRDHRVLPGWHTGVLWSAETALQVTHFLRHGTFCQGPGRCVCLVAPAAGDASVEVESPPRLSTSKG